MRPAFSRVYLVFINYGNNRLREYSQERRIFGYFRFYLVSLFNVRGSKKKKKKDKRLSVYGPHGPLYIQQNCNHILIILIVLSSISK